MNGEDKIDRAAGDRALVTDAAEERIAALFSSLGGLGKLKCYRSSTEGLKYVGTLHVDQELAENLEERIASGFGPGRYQLKAYLQSRCVRVVELTIDEGCSVGKPAAAPAAPAAPGGRSDVDLLKLIQEAEDRGRRQGTELVQLLVTVQDRHDARLEKLLAGIVRPAEASSSGDQFQSGIKLVEQVGKLLEGWGWSPPGDESADEPVSAAPPKGNVELFLEHAGPAIGSKIGEMLAAAGPRLLGGGSVSAEAPAASAPAAPAPAARAAAGEARGNSPEKLAAMRAARGRKAGGQ